MADRTVEMFDRVQAGFSDAKIFRENHYEKLTKEEALLDKMQVELTAYLLKCQSLSISESQRKTINTMLATVTELEELSDQCLTVGVFISRMEEKKLVIQSEDREKLLPYIELVRELLYFVYRHIGNELSKEQLDFANSMEEQIDEERTALKKVARTRLEQGSDVRAELLYIDIVRKVEKMGDSCFAIARQLGGRG